jgi:glyoxylase-like metal-dependent hydrolase (beta-lactamase superfamily II)
MTKSIHRVARFGLVNGYLVEEEDGLTVIDTGLKGMEKAVVAKAQELGAPIRRIALTHAHGDHVGSLDALAAQVPGVEVILSEREAPFLQKDMTHRAGEEGKFKGSWPGAQTKPTRTVQAGERIGSLEVVATPGHTAGHIAFLDTRDRTVYCGDVFSTIGGMASSAKTYWRFPLPAGATWDPVRDLESARVLRALEPTAIAPGHGKVVRDPLAAMDRAIARATA